MNPQDPVFNEPWEAEAFAMAVLLSQRGHFSWKEWTGCLAREIAADPGDGTRYYLHWLAALEKIVAQKKLVLADELARRKVEWDAAARATPHGRPIELPKK